MEKNKMSSDLLRGHTDTMILRLLLDGDHYGYELIKQIHQDSGGEYELKEATLYASMKRLENEGCITWYWGDETKGGRRKYYKISDLGRETYANNIENWQYAKKLLDTLL
ncbi:PadR family transcriptional regulator [Culicoidibacter larvae]|uniref:PadR family transcriptional regulator n=1 Tax=Culicoidibacter larvae TaxID=2579976 RepID=A0A5R8Q9K6_9FIRM|nr:PadR family transcriptional regulator [Culicoidibacter larvae]TLG72527.1 PadR family transcriptional regulator [Culicoidibacter larvae]